MRAWAPIWGGNSWVTWSTRSSTEALSFGTMIEISGWKEGTFQDLLRIWLSTPAPSGSRAFQPVPNPNKRSPQHSMAQSFFKIPQRAYSGISIKVSLSFFFPLQFEHAASYLSILQQWNTRGLGMRNAGLFFLIDFLLEHFYIHSKTEGKGQRFPLTPPSHKHSLPHYQHSPLFFNNWLT